MDTLIPITKRDHTRGDSDALKTLVMYGDYEHPRCGQAYQVIEHLLAEMDEAVHFVFRHFPLPQLHSNALHAAFAAEAADMQDTFWDMHAQLYQHQDALEDQEIIGYAAAIGLDLERFIGDMASIDVRVKVRRDVDGGMRSGVSTTPALYVNDRLQPADMVQDYNSLRAALDDELTQLGGTAADRSGCQAESLVAA